VKQPIKNGKIPHMKKTIQYFYIFSKLTTSLVLIFIIFIMGYALISSYRNIDNEVTKIDNRNNSISNEIIQNKNKFVSLSQQIDGIKLEINVFKKKLENYKKEIHNQEYKNDIENLYTLNNELKKTINKINKNLLIGTNNNIENKNLSLQKQISSAVNFIILKYKGGKNIDEEILYLEKIIPSNKIKNLEKINIIKLQKFYGFANLNNEFDMATTKLVNSEFVPSNKNLVLNFLLKFITIKPSNLNVYEKKDLNLLMNAKKTLRNEDLKSSLKIILKLGKNKKYFNKWIDQVNIYLDFIDEIEKVI
jgi:hypothetical protein